ncbi:protein-methionine-sulfoxide reductase heme-binding subunit MsrQ [Limnohabitans sp.]|jgi:sulfoxide reductase heme-binding subunit YedZ|uniref:sulfite oxidase heme-binding subunit YedZ n=1 Tax=Limnohabitans sp. TaxID=1907725 RepID=UPI0026310729|nr:protein-methionine-sulfoxide reductase heme-binding subunit MsrQ [Limnohabitans sp.]
MPVLGRQLLLTRRAWWLLLCVGLMPLLHLVWLTGQDGLGANPAEYLIRATGDWTLRGLCLGLAITPVRVQWGWPELARFRRLLGLLTYLYACLHLICYVLFDMGLDLQEIALDVLKRPFIGVGLCAWLLLSAMAATSFNRAVRWLGGVRWRALHRVVYAVAVLAVLHFWWMRAAKSNFNEVLVYALVLAALLVWRLQRAWPKRRPAA